MAEKEQRSRVTMTSTDSHSTFSQLKALVSPETTLRQGEPLARKTTLRVGGPAEFYLEPENESELGSVLQFAKSNHIPVMLLGRGSNLLIRDGGIPGLVISLNKPGFSQTNHEGQQINCGAGVRLKRVANEARDLGLAGLEFLEGIPGSVGGALRMNAGAMGGWMFRVTREIRFMTMDGIVNVLPADQIDSSYRHCAFFENHVALSATLHGNVDDRQAIKQRMDEGNQKRWATQPHESSAGCIFKNPSTIPSGKLIEELGLKGKRIGGASVSEIHGNFIVNDGTASAHDVLSLIEFIQQKVRSERGIDLQIEVQIVGLNTSISVGEPCITA